MYHVVEIDGFIRSAINDKGKPDKYTKPKGGIICLAVYTVGSAGSKLNRCLVNSTKGVIAIIAMMTT